MIRSHRQRSGITQEELAHRSGVSVRNIRDIEAGRVLGPRPSTVRRLAAALPLDAQGRDHLVSCAFSGPDPGPDDPVSSAAAARPVPAQLPPALPSFAGRSEHLAQLDAALSGPSATLICVVTGPAGVGKTTLATHWSQSVAAEFADGQLYANLGGFGPAQTAVAPADALRGFLTALGVPPPLHPVNLTEQIALYRSLLATRRVLILLDNARDESQVRPLLPGSSHCRVVVTSRDLLTGLVVSEGACPVPLDLVGPADARLILASRIGADRVRAEPAAVATVLAHCHQLPLALAIVSARLATRPALRLAAIAEDVSRLGPLDAYADDDPLIDVRTVLSWSYRSLPVPAARMFRLLALHPGPDLSVETAASLNAVPSREAHRLLTDLTRRHLVEHRGPNRYAQHDLIRAYATELAEQTDPPALRRAARQRMFDSLLHRASVAAGHLEPHREPPPGSAPGAPEQVGDGSSRAPADSARAADWFGEERRGLLALIRSATENGFDQHAWRLATAFTTFLQRQGHWHDQVAAQRLALAATIRLADEPGQALCHRGLARALLRLGQRDRAEAHLDRSLKLAGRHGDVVGQARTRHSLGYLAQERGNHVSALWNHRRALRLFTRAAHEPGRAVTMNSIAWSLAELGRHRSALPVAEAALTVSRRLGDRHAEAEVLDTMGYIHVGIGEYATATTRYAEAVELFRSLGERQLSADTWRRLAEVHARTGHHVAADRASRAAASLQSMLDRIRPLPHPVAAGDGGIASTGED
ncbi:ATP-binding protein [Micromonospora sp. BQ11]|uniref:ATP-binding protein n=1 Tax=Micromonospora sp. BQ11 TaxID=3452212 RepID=UPI003F8BABDD